MSEVVSISNSKEELNLICHNLALVISRWTSLQEMRLRKRMTLDRNIRTSNDSIQIVPTKFKMEHFTKEAGRELLLQSRTLARTRSSTQPQTI